MKTELRDIRTITRGIVVHGCNAQGVMRSGIAKTLRNRYPAIFLDYKALCDSSEHKETLLGKIATTYVKDDLYIVSGITQLYFGREPGHVYVSYPAVCGVFRAVSELAQELKLPVYFPKIGSGLGGGDWETIVRCIDSELDASVERTVCMFDESEVQK